MINNQQPTTRSRFTSRLGRETLPRALVNQQPTTNHQPPTTNHQQPTTNHQPPTTNHQPPTTNNHPPTTNHQPLTLMAEKQFCTFFVNGIYFGIDVQDVQEVIRFSEITRVPLAPSDICGLINLRGQIAIVINLQRRLEMSQLPVAEDTNTEGEADEQFGYNIVVRTGSEVVSLQVDNIGDIVKVTEEDFEPPPATIKGKIRQLLRGTYKLPEGFLLILDTEKILNRQIL
ncbi:MAG: chemotaxis protein CheW [Heteroscytonema crispum UTEX LB 1556]